MASARVAGDSRRPQCCCAGTHLIHEYQAPGIIGASEIVAVVRYGREEGTRGAEYAAMVEDRFQGRGLGIGLTRQLIEAARERGIESLHALVLRENAAMLHLLRSLDLPERSRREHGVEHMEIDLRPGAAA